MHRVALAFAYDGTRFDSFARQPGHRTVEGELVAALRRVGAFAAARSARFEVASRTDKRVSASWNVCAFDSELHAAAIAHRARTPPGLHLLTAIVVEPGFSPRRAATSRAYRYLVPDAGRYDWGKVRSAARAFRGLHDFRNFCRPEAGMSTVRRLDEITVSRTHDWASVQVTAPNFLWEQVRRIVHVLLAVGEGRVAVSGVKARLEDATLRAPEPPAAPEPLVLESIDLPVRFPPLSKSVRNSLAAEAASAELRGRIYAGLVARAPTARR